MDKIALLTTITWIKFPFNQHLDSKIKLLLIKKQILFGNLPNNWSN